MYEIRLVCEGPTDLEILKAALDAHLLGQDYQITMLQPDQSLYGGDAGPHGGGWKGVRNWCRAAAAAGGMEAVGALTTAVKLLVIHVDADIASDPEHRTSKPCPPPGPTIEAVERIVLDWLGVSKLPDHVALWIPCMATEAWVLRALFPELPESAPCDTRNENRTCVECIPKPADGLLGRYPKLVRCKNNELKKIRIEYVNARPEIIRTWSKIVNELTGAHNLQAEFNRWLPQ